MNVSMFSSWQVRCGIADYSAHLVSALQRLPDSQIHVVPFDRKLHPFSDFVHWGQEMNAGDVAHIQHEYAFFDYLLPWRNRFRPLVANIRKPLVITRHVSFDGPLVARGSGLRRWLWQAKWWLYQTRLNPYATYLNYGMFERANQIIVLTARIKDHLVKRGMDQKKIHVIPPGVPEVTPASPESAHAIRKALNWQDNRIIGQFGFIAPPKGHGLMIEALAQLPDDCRYLIAGDVRLPDQKPFLDNLLASAARLGIADRVHVTGFLPEAVLGGYLAACNVLVFPNTHADFSYSIVNALAYANTPIIVSDLYGHREIQRDSNALRLFESGSADALAAALSQFFESSANSQDFQQAVERYRQNFSWAAIAQHTHDVYRQAIQAR